jgi:uncharacterized membrane-anchored protein YhcB (DUF1043 family)
MDKKWMKLSSDGSGRVGMLSYQSELATHFSSRAALVSSLVMQKKDLGILA